MYDDWYEADPFDFPDWEWEDCLCSVHTGFHENCDDDCPCDGDD